MNKPSNLGQLFDQVVLEYPDSLALCTPNTKMTYSELKNEVLHFQKYLKAQAVRKGNVVAIFSDKSKYNYVMMLACLFEGTAYVNIDPESPVTRNKKILDQCSPSVIIGPEEYDLQNSTLPYVSYKAILRFDVSKIELVISNVSNEDIAYVMFTSGSTGFPKGVPISHASIFNFIEWGKEKLEINKKDNFANLSPLYFDNSVFDFYLSFFLGATLCAVPKDLFLNPIKFLKYMESQACTIWFAVPSLFVYFFRMKVLSGGNLESIRYFVFGGEAFPKSVLEEIYKNYPSKSFLNVYGPTECTCICSSYDVCPEDFISDYSILPLGKMNPNVDFVILDEDGNEGSSGELCLIGPNLTKGYYKDDFRTNKSFEFFSSEKFKKEWMYHTGDLVKIREGILYFQGRVDNQIKHMGYRIELEEIEGACSSLSYVKQSVAIYLPKEVGGEIVVFLLLNRDKSLNDVNVVEDLKKKLPYYMIPQKIIEVDNLPQNQNGKVDRNKLKENYIGA